MSGVNSFKVLREIFLDHKNADSKELDAYLHAGWKLVDIRQYDHLDAQTNEQIMLTVYIVGHTDPEAVPPKWDST
jgi:hypothetical protein